MENTIQLSSNQLLTKADIETASQNIVTLVADGQIDALQATVELAAIIKAAEDAKKAIAEYALKEADKYGAKTFELNNGVQVQIKSTTKYDYSGCASWSTKEKAIKLIKEQQKAIETQLKASKPGSPYVDAQTGEMIEGIPSTKSVSTTIIFK